MDKSKQDLLKAVIEQPSVYEIEVTDGSMLPDDLKDRDTVSITVKPPTLEVMSKCALVSLKIPAQVREDSNLGLEESLKYVDEMAEVVCILAVDSGGWCKDFIIKNLTPKELFLIFYESVLKMQTDFFLNSFQIANRNNPMMMMEKDLTRTNL